MTITISIIVPAYKVQNYIDACLQSILRQMESSHELVVIDDGSPDGTLARIEALRAAHPGVRFKVSTQPNQGISVTRNHGVAQACGEYIAFVDSDDILLPGALAALSEAIAVHQTDVVVCDFNMWRPDKETKSRRVSMGYPAAKVIRERSTILNTFFADRHMYLWAHVFRRRIFAQLPDPVFPPGRVFEDVATLPRLLSQCETLVYLPQPIVDYRQHPTSITRVITEGWCLDFASALALARRHLDTRGIDASVQRHFDIAAAYFYIGVVKNSYQLDGETGSRVRAQIKPIFIASLYGDCDAMLAAVRSGETRSHSRKHDIATIGQVKAALGGSVMFGLKQAASRKLKMWQRMRRTRKVGGN